MRNKIGTGKLVVVICFGTEMGVFDFVHATSGLVSICAKT